MTQHHEAPFLLTGRSLDALKLLATLLMLGDHLNEAVFNFSFDILATLGCGVYPLFAYGMACQLYRGVPVEKYLRRLALFALLSQPFFVLAFRSNHFNVLVTLALAAAISPWVLEQSAFRRCLLCLFAIVWSFCCKDVTDFDLVGVLFPAMLVGAFRKDTISILCSCALLVFFNAELDEMTSMENGRLVWEGFSSVGLLPIIGTFVVPLGVFFLCKTLQGARFLPRFFLYWFYMGHLALLALWRVWAEGWPLSLFSS
ncbi:MAG: hypothetical protein EP343_20360 [Deltaproteobacteria bacterium]|nr:MAG: hypothetical protein EP343_20360 [Deltaproteobacteria bacterium]